MIKGYLRASTNQQDALRAKDSLLEFAKSHNNVIASFYIENASGANLERAELNRLIEEATENDIVLVESMDRLTRLTVNDWETLKNRLQTKKIKIVAIDMPTSHIQLKGGYDDRMLDIFNTMFLDIYAEFARRDYELRRQRQQQGIDKAKRQGKFRGKQPNKSKHNLLIDAFKSGRTVREVSQITGFTERYCQKLKVKYTDEIR